VCPAEPHVRVRRKPPGEGLIGPSGACRPSLGRACWDRGNQRFVSALGALICAAESWRGLRFTEFELRQIAAVRKELDSEYEAKLIPSVIPPTLFRQIDTLVME
jgi:hypothetical protein